MNEKYKRIFKTIGPGILFAGAAIGGSHLIQSTRAGADYGFDLLIIVILANLFKYPFFEFSYRYTSARNKSILEGYNDLGKPVLITFIVLSLITGTINLAALALGSSGLLSYILGLSIDPIFISIGLVVGCIALITIGKYSLLDNVMKIMIVILTICTTIAFLMSVSSGFHIQPNFVQENVLEKSGILFIVALMGWMPAPIEASVWTSLWTLSKIEESKFKPSLKETLVDFHIGYIVTAVLAVFFLVLGAMIMYGTGISFSPNGTKFSAQIIELYTTLFGKWSAVIIAPAAFITLLSSLITVVDGYPRSLTNGAMILMNNHNQSKFNFYNFFVILLISIGGLVIVSFMSKNLKVMIDLATVISFLAAPIFAIINYKVVMSADFPNEAKPKIWLRTLAWMGIIFLIGFSLIYLWTLFYL